MALLAMIMMIRNHYVLISMTSPVNMGGATESNPKAHHQRHILYETITMKMMITMGMTITITMTLTITNFSQLLGFGGQAV